MKVQLAFIFFFILPFIMILIFCLSYNSVNWRSEGKKILFDANTILQEKQLELYLQYVFDDKISLTFFFITRFFGSLFVALIVCTITGENNIVLACIIYILLYKSFYWACKFQYTQKIQKANQIMPYYLKALISLCYGNPINNALVKSLQYADESLLDNLSQLIKELDADPLSYQPYANFLAKYHNRLKNGNFYFKSFYQLPQLSVESANTSLQLLSRSISEDLNSVRQQKNNLINETIGYLGLIPVVVLVVVLSYILVLAISYI